MSFFSRFFLFAALVALLGGCSASPPVRFFWPPPPDQPRLEFVYAYYSQNDMKLKGAGGVAKELLAAAPIEFARPIGIAVDSRKRVYVSDPGANDIKQYDFEKSAVKTLGQGLFGAPLGLAVDGQDRLYVVDSNRKKVLVFGPDFMPLFSFGGPEIFEHPNYMAVNDRKNRIYVSDARKHRVAVFDESGKFLSAIGRPGFGDGEFHTPAGVAIDAKDRVYVIDQFNFRVQVFDLDGKFLFTFGQQGDGPGLFELPKDLAIDSEGNVHVADYRKSALLSFSSEGQPLLQTGGQRTASPLGFSTPVAVAVDRDDRLYILDQFNKRFVAWQYLNEDYLKEHPIGEGDLLRLKEALEGKDK